MIKRKPIKICKCSGSCAGTHMRMRNFLDDNWYLAGIGAITELKTGKGTHYHIIDAINPKQPNIGVVIADGAASFCFISLDGDMPIYNAEYLAYDMGTPRFENETVSLMLPSKPAWPIITITPAAYDMIIEATKKWVGDLCPPNKYIKDYI